MLKTFWKYALIILIVSLFPVVINLALYQKIFFGKGNDWLSFWGNYTGGLISAIVAYIVVKYQIKSDLAKEKYIRTINQLPALLRVMIELEKYFKELQRVKEEREILNHNSSEEFDIDNPINENQYLIELPQSDDFPLLEKVEDMDLYIHLIRCFNFYRDFSSAMNYDMLLAYRKRSDLQITASDLSKEEKYSKIPVVHQQIELITNELTVYKNKKTSCWKTFYEDDMLSKFKEVLSRLDNEITTVKQIKETGDISLKEKERIGNKKKAKVIVEKTYELSLKGRKKDMIAFSNTGEAVAENITLEIYAVNNSLGDIEKYIGIYPTKLNPSETFKIQFVFDMLPPLPWKITITWKDDYQENNTYETTLS
ncbi:hypothetical protein [Bacillus gobiensis]|uniref:hypothetical protein n=1 Tax=Bacillus gobiensis TaxID=1441095 RepID=UPI003D1A81EC